MISSAIRAFFLCLLGMVLLVSCREEGFLSLAEAVTFSEHAPLSARTPTPAWRTISTPKGD